MTDFVDPYAPSPTPNYSAQSPGFVDPYQLPPPPPEPRSAPAEVGVGALRGALVDLPQMAGKTAQFVGADQTGAAIRGFADSMGRKSWLTMQPESHGAVTNFLAGGAENAVAGMAAPLAATGLVAAAPLELPAMATLGIGAVAGGLLMGGATGQDTMEKAQQAGPVGEQEMQGVRLAAAKDFAIGTAAGMVGGRMLGLGGTALGKAVSGNGQSLAQGVLQQITGGNGIVGTVAKSLATGAAENVGIGMTQGAAQAAIEKSYGIDPQADPMKAAVDNIMPMLAQSAVLGPLGIVHQTVAIRAARDHATALASGTTDANVRRDIAGQYFEALNKVDPEAAANFQRNAHMAIAQGANLPVDPSLLNPTPAPFVSPYARPEQPAPFVPEWYAPGNAPMGPPDGRTPPPESVVTQSTMSPGFVNALTGADLPPPASAAERAAYDQQMQAAFAEPSGVTGQDVNGMEVPLTRGQLLEHQEAGLLPLPAATPEEQQANLTNLKALHSQIVGDLKAGGENVAQPMTLAQFRQSDGKGLKDSALKDAYQKYLADPQLQAQLMREDAATWEAMTARNQAENTHAEARAGELNGELQPARPQDRENAETQPLGTQMRDALQQAMIDRASSRQEVESGMAALRRERGAKEADDAQAAYLQKEAELEALHGQVNDTLRANGIQPQEVTSTDEAARNKTIEANADAFEKLFADRAKEQVKPTTESSAPPEAPAPESQIADQLRNVMAERDALRRQAEEASARAQAAAAESTRIDAENDKTQRVAQDAETADRETERSVWDEARSREDALNAGITRLNEQVQGVRDGAAAIKAEGEARRNLPRRPMPRELREALPPKDAQATKSDIADAMGENLLPQDSKRVVNALKAAKVFDAPSLQQQVAKLREVTSTMKAGDQRDRMNMLADHWESQLPGAEPKAEATPEVKTPPPEVKPNGATEPVKTNGATPPAGNGEAKPPARRSVLNPDAPLPNRPGQETPVNMPSMKARVRAAKNRLNDTKVDLNDRVRQGERLSDGELARRESVDTLRAIFQDMDEKGIGHEEGQYTPDHVEQMLKEAKQTEKPWTEDKRAGHARVSRDVSEVNPDLLGPLAAKTGRLADALNHIAINGSTPFARRLAAVLARNVGEVTVVRDPNRRGPSRNANEPYGTVGLYEGRKQQVTLYADGMTERTLLHEAVHAATSDAIRRVETTPIPLTQRGRDQLRAANELEQIRKDLIAVLGKPDNDLNYGLTDLHEFLAELHSDENFQRRLDTTISPRTGTSFWSRIMNAIRRLLGQPTDRASYNALERAMAASEAFFKARRDDAEFAASPQGAVRVMDRNMHDMVEKAELWKANYEPADTWLQHVVSVGNSIRHGTVEPGALDLGNGMKMNVSKLRYGNQADAIQVLAPSGYRDAPWKVVGKLSRTSDGRINNLAVSPEYQRQGIGQAMIGAAEHAGLIDASLRPEDLSQAGAGALNKYRFGDEVHNRIAMLDRENLADNKVARKAFDFFLKFQTMQYIADRARALPELVRSGFSQAVDAYNKAIDSRRIVAEHVEGENGKYAHGVQQMLRALPADKRRDLSMQMMRLGGESSIGQFDYKLNYADNKLLHPDLDARNKSFIDGIHREFTQLQRTNPEAAKALVDGEKLARKDLVYRFATMVAHAMDTYAGRMGRLETELGRMAPEDAARAALEAQVANSRIEGQLAAIHSPGLDFMAQSLKGMRNTAPAFHHDGASATIANRLLGAFAAARELPEGSDLRAHIGELEHMFKPQYDNPYFSLGRNGDYFVKIAWKDMDAATQTRMQNALAGTNKVLGDLVNDPNRYAFFRFRTDDEAQGVRKKLETALGDRYLDGPKTASGLLSENHLSSVNGVTPALRSMLASMNDEYEHNEGLTREQVDQMKALTTRTLMSLLPETASRSARMERRGIAGYDGDFVGNFARRASASVQDLSNIYTARAFTGAHKGMMDAISQMNHTGSWDAKVRAQMIQNEVALRYANSMTRLDNTLVNRINSLGHSYYLALSPAFLIRTMAQPWHRGVPYLGAQYGAVKTSKELAAATGAAIKVIKNTMQQGWNSERMRGVLDAHMAFEGLGLSHEEEAFVREMHDRGVLNLGQSRQLQQMAIGGSPKMQDLVRFSAMTAQYAEMTNRFITGLAAYRLARKSGTETAKATEGAITAVNRVMDNFDPDNTARVLSKHGPLGKTGPLLTAFLNYNLQTMQQITRTVHDGFFGRDQSAEGQLRAKQAKLEFGGLMATTFVIAGAMGMPFANAAAGVWNMLTQDKDQPGDIRIDARNWMADHFGQWGGDLASHGIGKLIGMDTSTFGLENLLPGSEFLANRQRWDDRVSAQSQQLMGPAINGILDIMKAGHMISQGYIAKGVETALPAGLKAPYKALEMAGVIGQGGFTDTRGNAIPMGKPSAWDIALQTAGFRTVARANQSEFHEYLSQNEDRLRERRNVINDRVFKGIETQNPGTLHDAIGDMTRFNQHNPLMPIRGVTEAVRTHMMSNALGAATGTGVPVTQRLFPVAKNEGRFAAMPKGD